MTDLWEDIFDALFLFGNENLVPTYLDETSEYREICYAAEKKYTMLLKLLPSEGQELLKTYKSATDQSGWLELEATFHAGLVIGMNLAQL